MRSSETAYEKADYHERQAALWRDLGDILAERELREEVKPPPKNRPKFAIIVGHEENKPGAKSDTLGVHEYPWNKDLANRMFSRSSALDTRIFFRDGIGIKGAYDQAKAWGPAAIMELHFNSFDKPTATGTETLYIDPNKRYAEIVQQAMVGVLGLADRGVKERTDLPNLQNGQPVPTVLIEPFFGSNPDDSKTAEFNKDALASALMGAAHEFLTTT